MMNNSNFKNTLKDLRLEKGIKQKDVAKNCDISPQCVSQLELGTRNPTGTTLVALANFFNCSIDYLMGRSDDYEKSCYSSTKISSSKETECLKIFQELSTDFQNHLLDYMKKLLTLQNEERK